MNRASCKCGAWLGIGCICFHSISIFGKKAEGVADHLALGDQPASEVTNYHSTEAHYVDWPTLGTRSEWVIPGVRSTGSSSSTNSLG